MRFLVPLIEEAIKYLHCTVSASATCRPSCLASRIALVLVHPFGCNKTPFAAQPANFDIEVLIASFVSTAAGQRSAAKATAPQAQPAKGAAEGQAAKLSGIGLMMAQARNLRQRFYAESTVADSDSDWEDS